MSTFDLFAQKRGFSDAGLPTAASLGIANLQIRIDVFQWYPYPIDREKQEHLPMFCTKSPPRFPSPTHHSLLRTHHSFPMSIFVLFAQKRGFLHPNPLPSPPPTHHSLLSTPHSFPMSTFALLAQKRGFCAPGSLTGDPPPPPPNRRASPTKKMGNVSTLSTFALFTQKRGFSDAGLPTAASLGIANLPIRIGVFQSYPIHKIKKNRSIFPCFAQNHPSVSLHQLITHYSALITRSP